MERHPVVGKGVLGAASSHVENEERLRPFFQAGKYPPQGEQSLLLSVDHFQGDAGGLANLPTKLLPVGRITYRACGYGSHS